MTSSSRPRGRSRLWPIVFAVLSVMGIIGVFNLANAGPAFASPLGIGIYSCATVSGSIRFVPPAVTGGVLPETITIRLKASGCTGGVPVPASATGKATYLSTQTNVCPLAGVNGLAVPLHLTYPNAKRSRASVTVTAGAFWTLVGPVVAGSYKPGSLLPLPTATLKPVPVAGQICATGVSQLNIIPVSTLAGF